MKKKVLFVCIKNSSRSQMAEALLRERGRRGIWVRSAGITPGKEVNPLAVKAMAEVDIDMKGYQPNHISDFHDSKFDFVAKMDVPDLGEMIEAKWIEDWDIPDPAQGGIREFRAVRDLIERRIALRLGELLK
jgi:arsenate reductase